MEPVLRPAHPEDKEQIVAFTRGTFPWGDYIDRVFDQWLADPAGTTVVAEVSGEAVGLARSTLLSPAEAWAQGLRVHPQHRRRGLGTALLDRLADWATGQGAKVIRLSSEDSNSAAGALIPTVGFRPVGRWLIVEMDGLRAGPVPRGNGGRRAPAADRLRPAPAPEADAAMISWSGGPLEGEAHGLFSRHWSCRRLTLQDLADGARHGALWQGRPGWLLGEMDRDEFEVHWLSTDPEDARAMVVALLDLAAATGADRLEMQVPAVDWLSTAFEQAGCSTGPLTVYARGL
ncbi:MAG TPA: GNAT family N-acetyltransferase [Acidimicrobiia bacterium]|nr:GNAT family N-acetyltransferase [Acidimicrobiia bacterium]